MSAVVVFTALLATASAAPLAARSSPPPPPPANAAPQLKYDGDLCTVSGFDGVLVMDVAYDVPSQWQCAGVEDEMTIWCSPNSKKGGAKLSYCCSDACDKLPVPEERTCEVDGEEYTVGQAYEIELDGEDVTMWCNSEEEYVTCAGDECGSTLALTPPGELTRKPAPRPPVVTPKPPAPTTPEMFLDCYSCTRSGYTWQQEANQCTNQCAIQDISCVSHASQCSSVAPPVAPEWEILISCEMCTKEGYAWQADACRQYCHPLMGECTFETSKCTPIFD